MAELSIVPHLTAAQLLIVLGRWKIENLPRDEQSRRLGLMANFGPRKLTDSARELLETTQLELDRSA